jgi:two-component system, NarL family, response regulator YdfI
MIRVLVTASSPITRARLEKLLRSSRTLEVVSVPGEIRSLAESAADLQPDVVVVELGSAEEDPFEMLRELEGDAAVVVLVDDPDGAWVSEALEAGVQAILPHEVTGPEIIAGIHAASEGLVVLGPGIRPGLQNAIRRAADLQPLPEPLTAREVEVLRALADGLGNKEIAERLGISEHTVKFHVGSVMGKLGASSRTQAVTLGIQHHLVML